MKCLEAKNLDVSYGKKQIVFGFNFKLEECQIGCFLGPSGCGKTTVLRSIAGFEQPSKGEIILNGKKLNGFKTYITPEKRNIGMVFQDIALFPHLSVEENIQFGMRSWSREKRKKRTQELLELIGMSRFGKKYPHQLSGGQQQRIALARAMAPKPSLLLMDEPFSSLDAELREQLAREIRLILKQENISGLLVTHDQNEAFAMGDDICVINQGRVQQTDSAYNLYHNPKNRFVAEFIGEGSILSGVVVSKDTIETDLGKIKGVLPESLKKMANVEVLIRPENVVLSDMNEIQAVVKARYFRGSGFLYNLKTVTGHEIFSLITGQDKLSLDQVVGLRLKIEKPIVFNPSSGTLN